MKIADIQRRTSAEKYHISNIIHIYNRKNVRTMETMKDMRINNIEGFVFSLEPRPIVVEDGRVLKNLIIETREDLFAAASAIDELEASLKQNIAPVVYAVEYEDAITTAKEKIGFVNDTLTELDLTIREKSRMAVIK